MKYYWSVLWVCFAVLLPGSYVYGQRNYATQQTSGKTGGAEVKDPSFPVTFPDLTDRSRLKVNGVLESAYQILRFPAPIAAKTPVTIRLRWKSNVSLLGGLRVEPMMDADPVAGAFSLGTPLVLLGSGNEEELTLIPGSGYNGVRISISAGILSSAEVEILYAYYLDDPQIKVVPDPVCEGDPAQLQVLGVQPGLEYRLYTSETSGAPLIKNTSGIFVTPAVTAETTFYVEVVEITAKGVSRRVPVVVRVTPRPVIAAIPAKYLCAGQSLDLSTLNPAVQSGSTGGTYEWSVTAGGPPLLTTIITPFAGTSVYWLKYSVNGCSDIKSVTITTMRTPDPITLSLSKN